MQAKYCHRNKSLLGSNNSNGSNIVFMGEGSEDDDGFLGYEFTGIDLGMTHLDSSFGNDEGGWFHQDPFTTPATDENNKQITFHALCGNLTQSRRTVFCTPQPDAFK